MVAVRAPIRSSRASRSRQRMAWRVREGMQGIRDLEAPCLDALSGLPGASIAPSPHRFCRLEGRRACGSVGVGCVEGSENGMLGAVDGRDPGAGGKGGRHRGEDPRGTCSGTLAEGGRTGTAPGPDRGASHSCLPQLTRVRAL